MIKHFQHAVVFILAVTGPWWTINVYADTVVLKSGVSVEGKIIDRTDYEVTVRMPDGEEIPYMMSAVESIQGQKVKDTALGSGDPSNILDIHQPGTINILINGLMDLKGMSRDDIFALRQQYIHKVPSLAPANYQPSMAVFGQIQDGKPWWGVLGYYYYGPGDKSIEGDSYLSQFIINPYLLVGFTTHAYAVSDPSIEMKDRTPMPTKLVWEQNGYWGQVSYNISDFYQDAQNDRFLTPEILNLELLNARDLGFNFFSIDSSQSSGIKASVDKIIPLIQFIHTGGSCGYPGGCNNRSPSQDDLVFSFTGLPARVYIKLYKGQVTDISQKEDMDFIIDLN